MKKKSITMHGNMDIKYIFYLFAVMTVGGLS